MSGNTDEQMELLKQLRSLAETDDASKNRDSAMLNDAKNKWALLTKGVTTIQLIADAIKNEKVANAKEVRDNIHAVMKQFVKIAEKTPIQEDNCEVVNMRKTVITELQKAGVEPAELYSTPQQGTVNSLQRGGTTGGYCLRQPSSASSLAQIYSLMRRVSKPQNVGIDRTIYQKIIDRRLTSSSVCYEI